jgi:hypothetical protein
MSPTKQSISLKEGFEMGVKRFVDECILCGKCLENSDGHPKALSDGIKLGLADQGLRLASAAIEKGAFNNEWTI